MIEPWIHSGQHHTVRHVMQINQAECCYSAHCLKPGKSKLVDDVKILVWSSAVNLSFSGFQNSI